MKFSKYTLAFLFIVLMGCSNQLEFSPNQSFDEDSPKDLNRKNLMSLTRSIPDDTIVIAFVGDSQRFYDNLDGFVRKANSIEEIDFVLLAGDISDFGLLQEFEWVYESFSKLNKPFFGVVGNHDLQAQGEEVFRKMFGELNESFVYDSVKFILHNTNSREYLEKNVPDLEWLENELKPSPDVKHFVTVSHVPPFDNDFNPDLVDPYATMLRDNQRVLTSLHGHVHQHRDFFPFGDNIRYLTSYSFDQRSFLLLKIANGEVFKTIIDY